jgi:hypothetical protein
MMTLSSPWVIRTLVLLVVAGLLAPVAIGLWDVRPALLEHRHRRPLAQIPETAMILADPHAALKQGFGYLTDRAAGVFPSVGLLGRLRHETLGDAGAGTLVRNGPFVFLTDHAIGEGRNFKGMRMSCEEPSAGRDWLATLSQTTRDLHARLGTPTRRVSFVAIPSKPVVYADALPVQVPPDLRAACARAGAPGNALDRWVAEMTDEGIVAVHPLEPLRRLGAAPEFYPAGNFHAEGAGAHVAAWSLLNRLRPGEWEPGSVPMIPQIRKADLNNMLVYKRQIPMLVPDYGDKAVFRALKRIDDLRARYPMFPLVQVWRPVDGTRRGRALVIANSFGNYLTEHIAPAFAETVLVYTNGITPEAIKVLMHGFMDEFAPHEVIFLFHDGSFKTGALNPFRDGL